MTQKSEEMKKLIGSIKRSKSPLKQTSYMHKGRKIKAKRPKSAKTKLVRKKSDQPKIINPTKFVSVIMPQQEFQCRNKYYPEVLTNSGNGLIHKVGGHPTHINHVHNHHKDIIPQMGINSIQAPTFPSGKKKSVKSSSFRKSSMHLLRLKTKLREAEF